MDVEGDYFLSLDASIPLIVLILQHLASDVYCELSCSVDLAAVSLTVSIWVETDEQMHL